MDALGARPSCTVPEATSVLIGTRAQRGASMRNSASEATQAINDDANGGKNGESENADSAGGPTNITLNSTERTNTEW